ncbi:hypothetical protein KAI52_03625 [Candidatus Parcubacteria bacterium]|nr:hypothetical protein [Candidatus Parcubacteria bacterium]
MNKDVREINKNYKKCLYCAFLNPKNVKRCIKCGKKFVDKKKFASCLFRNKNSCGKINFPVLSEYFKKLQQNPQYKPNAEENREIAKIIFLIIFAVIGFIIFTNIISSFN